MLLFLESFYFRTYAFYWDLLKGVLTIVIVLKNWVGFSGQNFEGATFWYQSPGLSDECTLVYLNSSWGRGVLGKRISKELKRFSSELKRVFENIHVLKGFAGDTRYIYQPSPRVSSSVPIYCYC